MTGRVDFPGNKSSLATTADMYKGCDISPGFMLITITNARTFGKITSHFPSAKLRIDVWYQSRKA